jgi:hypothetical protein
MPAQTLGFRLSGKVNLDEYFLIPEPIREKLRRGEKVQLPRGDGRRLPRARHGSALGGHEGRRVGRAVAPPGEIRILEPEFEDAKGWTGGSAET